MFFYVAVIIGLAEAEAANAAANAFFGDAGDNLAGRASPTGEEPATHLHGGSWIGAPTLAALQAHIAGSGLSTMRVEVASGPDMEALPEQARSALFASVGVQPIEIGA